MALAPPQRARLQASLAAAGTLLMWAWLGGKTPAVVAGLACTLAVMAWVSPPHYAPIQQALDRLVKFVLTGLTWLLLGAIYLGVFTPLRLWRALTRQDPLQRRADPGAPTYFHPLPPASPGRFDRQF